MTTSEKYIKQVIFNLFIVEIPLWNAIQNPRRDRKFGSRQCQEEKLSWNKNKQEVEKKSCIFT